MSDSSPFLTVRDGRGAGLVVERDPDMRNGDVLVRITPPGASDVLLNDQAQRDLARFLTGDMEAALRLRIERLTEALETHAGLNFKIQRLLDEALGTVDAAGAGVLADLRLLIGQRDEARRLLAATENARRPELGWE